MTRTTRLVAITNAVAVLVPKYPNLQHAHGDLCDTLVTFTQAMERLELAINDGLGAQSFDGGRGGGDNGSVPERLAAAGSHDPAADALAEVDRCLRHLAQNVRAPHKEAARLQVNARTLWRITTAWTPHKPTDKDKRAVLVANSPDIGCEHHARAGIFEPVHREGTVGGNLDLPMRLCLACHNQVRRNGRLPSGEWMERRQRTGKDEKEKVT